MKEGLYIAFEGIVGTGKTTQSRILAEKLGAVWTKEPGGGEIADLIRKVVQGTEFSEVVNPVTEQYLYAASRAQTLRTVVKPVLDRGGIAVSDRSVWASVAFQGFGRGLGRERVLKINEEAVGDLWPDLVVLMNLDIDVCMARAKDQAGDKFEKMGGDFFERVVAGYLWIAKNYDTVFSVDASGTIDEVEAKVWEAVLDFRSRMHI